MAGHVTIVQPARANQPFGRGASAPRLRVFRPDRAPWRTLHHIDPAACAELVLLRARVRRVLAFDAALQEVQVGRAAPGRVLCGMCPRPPVPHVTHGLWADPKTFRQQLAVARDLVRVRVVFVRRPQGVNQGCLLLCECRPKTLPRGPAPPRTSIGKRWQPAHTRSRFVPCPNCPSRSRSAIAASLHFRWTHLCTGLTPLQETICTQFTCFSRGDCLQVNLARAITLPREGAGTKDKNSPKMSWLGDTSVHVHIQFNQDWHIISTPQKIFREEVQGDSALSYALDAESRPGGCALPLTCRKAQPSAGEKVPGASCTRGSQTLYLVNSLALGLSTALSRQSPVRPAPMLARELACECI